MGILSFFNIQEIISRYNTRIFVETGLGAGNGLFHACRFQFNHLYSIELLHELVSRGRSSFSEDRRIIIIGGKSPKVLRMLLPRLAENILFFLDAHYPGLDGFENGNIMDVPEDTMFPIREELEAISNLRGGGDVIIIDDAKIYTNGKFELSMPEGYPQPSYELKPIICQLFGNTHEIYMFSNHDGYIVLYPKLL